MTPADGCRPNSPAPATCPRRDWLRFALLLAGLSGLTGCHSPGLRADRAGRWLPIRCPQTAARTDWTAWAEAHLQSGDLLFVAGDSRILLGWVNFSQLAREVTDSPFSHIGLAAREDGQWVVYDTVPGGPRRIRLADFLADRRVRQWAIRRVRDPYRHTIPAALEYCQDVWQRQVPFDERFGQDHQRLYCSEMVEMAYRHGGLELSEPVPLNQLPGYDSLSPHLIRLIRVAARLRPEQPVFVPGNDSLGIWSSPHLEPVLEVSDLREPPEEPAGTLISHHRHHDLATP